MAEFGIGAASQLTATVITAAATKIAQKVQQEVSLIKNFKSHVSDLQIMLNDLTLFLNDAESGASQTQQLLSVAKWLRDLSASAMDAEDIIELCVIQLQKHEESGGQSFFNGHLRKLRFKRKWGLQIRQISKRLNELLQQATQLGMQKSVIAPVETGAGSSNDQVRYQSFKIIGPVITDHENVSVDMDPKISKIVGLLRTHRKVAIVGLGGSGKTLLLKHVYQSMKSSFDRAIWLCIFQTYSVTQLQMNVLGTLGIEYGRETQDILQQKIHDALLNKTCLVVLDDIWDLPKSEKSRGHYQTVAQKLSAVGFPQCCKILISTRDTDVAVQMEADSIYTMPLLSLEKSKDLFLKHVGQEHLDDKLDETVKKALKRCGGLPLAVLTIAGLLKRQCPCDWALTLSLNESSSSSSSSSSSPEDPQEGVINLLKLSFDALDPTMKACFAYLGMLQENEEVEPEQVIGMWKAEGLVQCHYHGEAVLKNLCDTSLLQISYRATAWKPYVVITMHGLVHQLAVSLFTECGGCVIRKFSSAQQQQTNNKFRRIRVPCSVSIPSNVRCPASVRSLRFTGGVESSSSPTIPNEFLANAYALKALVIPLSNIRIVDESVGKLRLLKFLNLEYGMMGRALPECLRHMKSLEYLCTNMRIEVPPWITELRCLTHLSAAANSKWLWKPRDPMTKLQMLRNICIRPGGGAGGSRSNDNDDYCWGWDSISVQLPQLQELRLEVNKFDLPRIRINLPLLRTLTLVSIEFLGTSPATSPPDEEEWHVPLQGLQTLMLQDIRFPSDVGRSFQSLQFLTIVGNHSKYPAVICALPELTYLALLYNGFCTELPLPFGRTGAFPKLQELRLWYLSELRKLPVLQDGSMPRLRVLSIKRCWKLEEAAAGWSSKASALTTLGITDVHQSFELRTLGLNSQL